MSFRSIEQSIGWRNSLWGSFYAKNKIRVEAKSGGVREEMRDDEGAVAARWSRRKSKKKEAKYIKKAKDSEEENL